jgi:hypothetical protein
MGGLPKLAGVVRSWFCCRSSNPVDLGYHCILSRRDGNETMPWLLLLVCMCDPQTICESYSQNIYIFLKKKVRATPFFSF